MENEELISVLREFEKKRVEELPEDAKRLFYAIMSIADDRDKYKSMLDGTKAPIRYKTYEDLKKEFGNGLELYLYNCNLELIIAMENLTDFIKIFMCSEEYNRVDGKAIARNYEIILKTLGEIIE